MLGSVLRFWGDLARAALARYTSLPCCCAQIQMYIVALSLEVAHFVRTWFKVPAYELLA